MKRRTFLRSSALASTSLFVPSFLQASFDRPAPGSRMGKILVVIQLSGGNDGLNTVVPYRNDEYYRLRPRLALSSREILPASDELGFHTSLQGLQELYDEGWLSVVNNVGYPNPDRSHFRSMDIWHTASNSNEYWNTGWLGRYLDSDCAGCENLYHALEVDDSLSLALKGSRRNGFAMSDAGRLRRTSQNEFLTALGEAAHEHHHEEPAAYLYKVMADTQASANYLYQQSKLHPSRVSYPANAIGRSLKQVAELITADTATQVYYLSLSGFDTHANQKMRQARLLKQYADGVKAFVKDLAQNGLLDDTLILTFSEFGRRVKQNASNGTDHGTANNVFLIGSQLNQPGFFNPGPDLLDLDEGDLKYQVDFRSVYTSILEKWLAVKAPEQVLGGRFSTLGLL